GRAYAWPGQTYRPRGQPERGRAPQTTESWREGEHTRPRSIGAMLVSGKMRLPPKTRPWAFGHPRPQLSSAPAHGREHLHGEPGMKHEGRARRHGVRGLLRIAAAIAVSVMAAAPSPRAETVNRIVATIDGEPVTLVELETYTEQMRQRGGADKAN